jgi:ApbE superfamily uncharacterized protein (UPF0280 family)
MPPSFALENIRPSNARAVPAAFPRISGGSVDSANTPVVFHEAAAADARATAAQSLMRGRERWRDVGPENMESSELRQFHIDLLAVEKKSAAIWLLLGLVEAELETR